MKSVLPLIVLLVMGAMLMISWSNVSDTKEDVAEKYKTILQEAEEYEAKEIYVDAIKKYESALKMKPDYNMSMKVAGMYQKMNNDKGYLDMINNAIDCDKTNPEPYFLLIDYYEKQSDFSKLYKELVRADGELKDSDRLTDAQKDKIRKLLKKLKSQISVNSFVGEEFLGFHRYEGKGSSYAKVCVDGLYGIMNAGFSNYIAPEQKDVGYPNGGLIPLNKNNEYYYIDTEGNRKIVPDEPATAIGAFGGGKAPLQVDGKYGYIDFNMNESHFDYEFAGSFENGIAPVKQNGKWFVINPQFAAVGPNFDEILVDAYGFCAPYGVYFGKSGNNWGMYNTAGEKIADGFEEVRQFASTQPAAVKKDGKWCFISLDGAIVLETDYADADSFSLGYAPVQKGDLWGCIDQENDMLIDPQFKHLSSFNEEGNAIGENAEGLCTVNITRY